MKGVKILKTLGPLQNAHEATSGTASRSSMAVHGDKRMATDWIHQHNGAKAEESREGRLKKRKLLLLQQK